MNKEIELGDTVKCIYTGFIGIATAKTEFINGCVQYSIAPKWKRDDRLSLEELGIDSESLVVIKKGKRAKEKEKEEKDEDNGGPMRKAPIRRGF